MKKLIKWLIAPMIIDIVHDWYYDNWGPNSSELKDGTPLHIKRYYRIMDKRCKKAHEIWLERELQNMENDLGVKE